MLPCGWRSYDREGDAIACRLIFQEANVIGTVPRRGPSFCRVGNWCVMTCLLLHRNDNPSPVRISVRVDGTVVSIHKEKRSASVVVEAGSRVIAGDLSHSLPMLGLATSESG